MVASAPAEVRELTLKRAEGLGLAVDEILSQARAGKPDNLDAYFQSICRKRIRERLPNLNDDLIRKAFSRDPAAFGTVCNLLTMATQ